MGEIKDSQILSTVRLLLATKKINSFQLKKYI